MFMGQDRSVWVALTCSAHHLSWKPKGHSSRLSVPLTRESSNGQPTHSHCEWLCRNASPLGLWFHLLLITALILQIEKLRLLEVKWFAQGYGGSKRETKSFHSKFNVLITIPHYLSGICSNITLTWFRELRVVFLQNVIHFRNFSSHFFHGINPVMVNFMSKLGWTKGCPCSW